METHRVFQVAFGLAVVAAVLAACGSGASTPHAAVRSLFEAVGDGDGERACELATADAQATLIELTERAEGSSALSCSEAVSSDAAPLRGAVVEEAVTTTEGPEEAMVWVKLQVGDREADDMAMLVREDGDWRLLKPIGSFAGAESS